MLERQVRNAKITGTKLGYEDHRIFTFYLNLDYGGLGQGAGGLCLDEPKKSDSGEFLGRFGTAYGMQVIIDILNCLEVDTWEEVKGQMVRVDSSSTNVYRIGHLLKDQWVDIAGK